MIYLDVEGDVDEKNLLFSAKMIHDKPPPEKTQTKESRLSHTLNNFFFSKNVLYSEKLFTKNKLIGIPEIIYTFTQQSKEGARKKLFELLEKDALKEVNIIKDDIDSATENVKARIDLLKKEVETLTTKNSEIRKKQVLIEIRKKKLEKEAEELHNKIESKEKQDHRMELTQLNDTNKKLSKEEEESNKLQSEWDQTNDIIEMKNDEIAKFTRTQTKFIRASEVQQKLNSFALTKWNGVDSGKDEISIENLTPSQFKEKKTEIFKQMEDYDMNARSGDAASGSGDAASGSGDAASGSGVMSKKIPTQQEKIDAWEYVLENIKKTNPTEKVSVKIKNNITFMTNVFLKKDFFIKGKRKFLLKGKEYDIYDVKNIQVKKRESRISETLGREEKYIVTASIRIYDKENPPSIFKRQNCNVKKKLIKDQLRKMFPGFFGRFDTVYDVTEDKKKEKIESRKKQEEKTLYKEYIALRSKLKQYEKEIFDLDRKDELEDDDIDKHSELSTKIEKIKKILSDPKYKSTRERVLTSKRSSLYHSNRYSRDRYSRDRYSRDRYGREQYYGGSCKTKKRKKENNADKKFTKKNNADKKYTEKKFTKKNNTEKNNTEKNNTEKKNKRGKTKTQRFTRKK